MTATILLDYILIASSSVFILFCLGFMAHVAIALGKARDMPKYKRAIMPVLMVMTIPSAVYLVLNPTFINVLSIACGTYLLFYAILWYYVMFCVFMQYEYYFEGRIFIGLTAFFFPVAILYLLVSFGIIV